MHAVMSCTIFYLLPGHWYRELWFLSGQTGATLSAHWALHCRLCNTSLRGRQDVCSGCYTVRDPVSCYAWCGNCDYRCSLCCSFGRTDCWLLMLCCSGPGDAVAYTAAVVAGMLTVPRVLL